MKTALNCQLADERKAAKHPTLPAHARVKAKYSDQDANGLTRAVVDYLTLSGHFATRLASTGTYRADVDKYIPSQQRAGFSTVFAVVEGRAMFAVVEGWDSLSQQQKETIADLQKAGASVYAVRNFAEFLQWFTAEFLTPPFP